MFRLRRAGVFFLSRACRAKLFCRAVAFRGKEFIALQKIFRLRRARPSKISLSRACRARPTARQRDKKKH